MPSKSWPLSFPVQWDWIWAFISLKSSLWVLISFSITKVLFSGLSWLLPLYWGPLFWKYMSAFPDEKVFPIDHPINPKCPVLLDIRPVLRPTVHPAGKHGSVQAVQGDQ